MEIHLLALICSPLGSDHRTSSQKPESKEIQSASKECWETVLNQPSILSYLHGVVLASEMHSDVVWMTYEESCSILDWNLSWPIYKYTQILN